MAWPPPLSPSFKVAFCYLYFVLLWRIWTWQPTPVGKDFCGEETELSLKSIYLYVLDVVKICLVKVKV